MAAMLTCKVHLADCWPWRGARPLLLSQRHRQGHVLAADQGSHPRSRARTSQIVLMMMMMMLHVLPVMMFKARVDAHHGPLHCYCAFDVVDHDHLDMPDACGMCMCLIESNSSDADHCPHQWHASVHMQHTHPCSRPPQATNLNTITHSLVSLST